MEPKVNYTVVGLFVLILGFALIFIAFWLTAGRHKSYNTYLTYMDESVAGLTSKAPVKFNGVDVGYVDDISLNPANIKQVRLRLNIGQEIPVTKSTVAVLQSQGITGITFIGLKAKTPDAPLLVPHKGERYAVIPSEPSFLVQLDTILQDFTTSFQNIGSGIRRVLDKDNALSFKQTLLNLESFTAVLAKNDQKINQVLNNMAQASKKFPSVISISQRTLEHIQVLVDSLQETSHEAQKAFKNSRTAINTVNDQTLPQLNEIMSGLNQITSNLAELSIQLNHNPSVLLRGKKDVKLGPGER